ncbi:helix-turn-helix domain-containing protein [Phycisphaerales bacterium AB-hyl4]|uniref:Helix-turn-helix domain-containing protein n=1 Tax=Natronomicrosphaera hydrolytica TaxID=3242702 RepID=A0ABV4U7S3_9BACT
MQTVGEIVRARREALGLTLSALAERVGVTKGYLSMIENHRVANPPSRKLLASLEEALELEGGALRRLAGVQSASPEVREALTKLADDARRGRELAEWLKQNTSRRAGGGKNLDRLYRSGRLRRKISETLETVDATDELRPASVGRGHVPLINKVAAGYPTGFTDLDYPARVADETVPFPGASGVEDPDAFAATVVGESMQPVYGEGDIVVFSPMADVVDGNDCFVRLEPDHETTFKRVYFDQEAGTVRLQPLNPAFAPQVVPREQVAGLYRAVWRMSRL